MAEPEADFNPDNVLWGTTLHWDCGHVAIVVGEHDWWHEPHHCPVCRPGETTCVEFLDVHRKFEKGR